VTFDPWCVVVVVECCATHDNGFGQMVEESVSVTGAKNVSLFFFPVVQRVEESFSFTGAKHVSLLFAQRDCSIICEEKVTNVGWKQPLLLVCSPMIFREGVEDDNEDVSKDNGHGSFHTALSFFDDECVERFWSGMVLGAGLVNLKSA
jgi:hypothetical protein